MSNYNLKRLKELLDFDEKTGLFTWKCRRGHVGKGAIAGSLDKDGYIKIRADKKILCAHRIAWGFFYGEIPSLDFDIDHKNGNRSDNRITNLRLATRSQNNFNAGMKSNNTTGYKGVSYQKNIGKYAAEASINKVKYRLGFYDTAKEAGDAYKNFVKKMHGEYLHDISRH